MKKIRINRCFWLLFLILLLTGCSLMGSGKQPQSTQESRDGADEESGVAPSGAAKGKKEETTDSSSRIFIICASFGPEDPKTAVFVGNDLADYFRVLDADTGRSVYEGRLEKLAEADGASDALWKGDFSELSQEGTYFIRTPVIGSSPVFRIQANAGEEQQKELQSLWNKKSRIPPEPGKKDEFTENARALLLMGQVYEMQNEPTDETEFQPLIEAADALRAFAEEEMAKDVPDTELCSVYASAMAQTAFVISDQKEAADRFREQAQMAYDRLPEVKMPQAVDDDGGIRQTELTKEELSILTAQAALYKLTRKTAYVAGPEACLGGCGSLDGDHFDMAYFYLTTPKDVDVEICDRLMKLVLNGCNETLDGAVQSEKEYAKAQVVGRKVPDQIQEEEFLAARLLKLADYALVSEEYRRMLTGIRQRNMTRAEDIGELDCLALAERLSMYYSKRS